MKSCCKCEKHIPKEDELKKEFKYLRVNMGGLFQEVYLCKQCYVNPTEDKKFMEKVLF